MLRRNRLVIFLAFFVFHSQKSIVNKEILVDRSFVVPRENN